ncbi:hypothetical protein LEP1GSC047_0953 [Leptospira inadai serovar Lyme str. 10]|uniref:Yip1 domain protein n=2 Tax=Leptospira inadai serovar Lyme TaxID=293084 RepID=V6HQM0_9LEPT|nr:hypothetical protein [Leptospira inadai]EQA34734.1 hypothetical protein LEP1GSC047_0953 [Leptospira inadai serovar Lyme str. 10]PNV71503.1 hypothetical protein BES34_021450 [Leptospira inadai serovar Lyme]
MLKIYYTKFIDLLDATLFEPFRLENTVSGWDPRFLKIVASFILILSSLSAATGFVLVCPPYTHRSVGLLISGFFGHLTFFALLPYPLAFILDGLAQRKDRRSNSKVMFIFAQLSISIFLSLGAWAVLFAQLGLSGGIGIIILYLIHYGLFIIVLIRGTMYLYELKFRDALSFNISTFLVSFFFPLTMYFAIGSSFGPAFQ